MLVISGDFVNRENSERDSFPRERRSNLRGGRRRVPTLYVGPAASKPAASEASEAEAQVPRVSCSSAFQPFQQSRVKQRFAEQPAQNS